MAILESNNGRGLQINELCPEGTYVAVIGKIDDQFGVQRPKFENPQEMETIDVTRFIFGVVANNQCFRVQTYEMRISGNPKSKLFSFLTSLLGKPPAMGWDYCALQGSGAVIQVAHRSSRDGSRTYANVVAVRPAKDNLGDYSSQVPDATWFDWGEDAAQPAPAAPQPQARIAPPSVAPQRPQAPSAPAPQAPARPNGAQPAPLQRPAPAAAQPPRPGPAAPAAPSRPAPQAPAPQAPAWSPEANDPCPF